MRSPKSAKIMRFVAHPLVGGHYPCCVYVGVPGDTFAKIGDIVLDETDLMDLLMRCSFSNGFEFVNRTAGPLATPGNPAAVPQVADAPDPLDLLMEES